MAAAGRMPGTIKERIIENEERAERITEEGRGEGRGGRLWWSAGYEQIRGFERTPCEQMISTMLWCNYLLHGRRIDEQEEIDNPAFLEHIRELLPFILPSKEGLARSRKYLSLYKQMLPASSLTRTNAVVWKRHCKPLNKGDAWSGFPINHKMVKGVSLSDLDLCQQLLNDKRGNVSDLGGEQVNVDEYLQQRLKIFNQRPFWEYLEFAAQDETQSRLAAMEGEDPAALTEEDRNGFRRFCTLVAQCHRSGVLIPCTDVREEAWLSARPASPSSDALPAPPPAPDVDPSQSSSARGPTPHTTPHTHTTPHKTYAEFMAPSEVPTDFRGQSVSGDARLYWVDLEQVRFKHSKIANEGDVEVVKTEGGAGEERGGGEEGEESADYTVLSNMKELTRDAHFYTRLMRSARSSKSSKVIAPLQVFFMDGMLYSHDHKRVVSCLATGVRYMLAVLAQNAEFIVLREIGYYVHKAAWSRGDRSMLLLLTEGQVRRFGHWFFVVGPREDATPLLSSVADAEHPTAEGEGTASGVLGDEAAREGVQVGEGAVKRRSVLDAMAATISINDFRAGGDGQPEGLLSQGRKEGGFARVLHAVCHPNILERLEDVDHLVAVYRRKIAECRNALQEVLKGLDHPAAQHKASLGRKGQSTSDSADPDSAEFAVGESRRTGEMAGVDGGAVGGRGGREQPGTAPAQSAGDGGGVAADDGGMSRLVDAVAAHRLAPAETAERASEDKAAHSGGKPGAQEEEEGAEEEVEALGELLREYAVACSDGRSSKDKHAIRMRAKALSRTSVRQFFEAIRPMDEEQSRRQRAHRREQHAVQAQRCKQRPSLLMQRLFGKRHPAFFLAESAGGDPDVDAIRALSARLFAYLDEQDAYVRSLHARLRRDSSAERSEPRGGEVGASRAEVAEGLLTWELTHLGNSWWYLLHNSDVHGALKRVLLDKFPFLWPLTHTAVPVGAEAFKTKGAVRYGKTDDPILEDLILVLRHTAFYGLNEGTQLVTAADLAAWQRRELAKERPFAAHAERKRANTKATAHLHPDVLRARFPNDEGGGLLSDAMLQELVASQAFDHLRVLSKLDASSGVWWYGAHQGLVESVRYTELQEVPSEMQFAIHLARASNAQQILNAEKTSGEASPWVAEQDQGCLVLLGRYIHAFGWAERLQETDRGVASGDARLRLSEAFWGPVKMRLYYRFCSSRVGIGVDLQRLRAWYAERGTAWGAVCGVNAIGTIIFLQTVPRCCLLAHGRDLDAGVGGTPLAMKEMWGLPADF